MPLMTADKSRNREPKAPPQPGPGAAPGKADTRDLCSKLAFVTSSPLPSTGLRWDYKCQLQASGGIRQSASVRTLKMMQHTWNH